MIWPQSRFSRGKRNPIPIFSFLGTVFEHDLWEAGHSYWRRTGSFSETVRSYLVLGQVFDFFVYITLASSTLDLQSRLLNLSLQKLSGALSLMKTLQLIWKSTGWESSLKWCSLSFLLSFFYKFRNHKMKGFFTGWAKLGLQLYGK